MNKITALVQYKGNFDAFMQLSGLAIRDVQWWIGNVQSVFKPLSRGPINIALFTDASLEWWGAVIPSAGTPAQGVWSPITKREHINIHELKAVLLGLKHICHLLSDQHIQLHIDSMTAVNYIKNFGVTRSPACNAVIWEIWDWADNRNIWLSPTHIAGKDNVVADQLSRQPIRNGLNITEWALDHGSLDQVWQMVDKPDIVLFASSLNAKYHRYVSWGSDSSAWKIDAFSFSWTDLYVFVFPPFAILNRTLKKLEEDQATAILIAPCWPAACWFPRLLCLLTAQPLQLPFRPRLLQHPQLPHLSHPSVKTMRMTVWPISGSVSSQEDF